mgnify:CR=1 FL=1
MFGTRKLGKNSTQRKALLRQLATDLLNNGRLVNIRNQVPAFAFHITIAWF